MSDDQKDQDKLMEGEEQVKLESGDDLALQALSEAEESDGVRAALNSDDDEIAKSDEIAQTLQSLQNLIERNANALDEIKDELKNHRESLRSVFENDAELLSSEEQARQYNLEVKDRKTRLQSDPTVVSLQTKIGDLKEREKEIKEALSNHLVNYYQLTNSKSIDTSDGDQREFEIRANIKSARRRKQD